MKKILLVLLLFIPTIAFTQLNSGSDALEQSGKYSVSDFKSEVNHPVGNDYLLPFTALYLKKAVDSKFFLDSSYVSRFSSESDSALTKVYYAYDAKGNEILENRISSCFTCSSGVPGKIESEFDSNGNMTKYITYILTQTNKYIPELKVEQSYNGVNKITHIFHSQWEVKSSQWINSSKRDYSYNADDQLINEVFYLWDINNKQWTNYYKMDQSFDHDGNVVFFASYNYSQNTGQWKGSEKRDYVFDENNLLSLVKSKWNENTADWINSEKLERKYDSSFNKTLETTYLWNEPEQRWGNYEKWEYYIGPNNKITGIKAFGVDANNQWIALIKEEYSYDENGNTILKLRLRWDTETNQWMNEWKFEMDYNSNNQLITQACYEWNQSSTLWVPVYENNFWFDQYSNKTKETSHQWNSEGQWMIYYKYEYFYSLHSIVNSLELSDTPQIKLYPNPVYETFTLELDDPSITQCQLFNSSGQLLQTLPVQMGINAFSVSHLRQGMYLLKIKAKEGMVVKKLIKK